MRCCMNTGSRLSTSTSLRKTADFWILFVLKRIFSANGLNIYVLIDLKGSNKYFLDMGSLKPSIYIIRFLELQKKFLIPNSRSFVSTNSNLTRQYSTAPKAVPCSEKMTEKIRNKFPSATQIEVEDVSSGCGYMFRVFVEAKEFKGLSTVKQHRLINEVLKEDIANMHGLRIETKVPDDGK